MLKKIDIYKWDKKIARYDVKINEFDFISEETKDKIRKFKGHLYVRNLSKGRILKYMETLYYIIKYSKKDPTFFTKDDVSDFVGFLNQKDYSPWTSQIFKVVLKKYLTWLNDGVLPESVAWMKIHISGSEKKLPGDGELLTQEDIQKILDTCDNIRDKCLITVLYESGCRIGEIASLRVGNVVFDNLGVVITVIGKTGSRKIRLVKSTSALRVYIDNHPNRKDPTAPIWINRGNYHKGQQMLYCTFRMLISRLCKKANINKRCNPHIFRHSRATELASHLTEFQMNQYFGWIQGSGMPASYVHLNGRDIEGAILNMNGIKSDRDVVVKDKPIQCPRCEFINPHDKKHCERCALILDSRTAVDFEENEQKKKITNMVMSELMKEPSIKNHLLSKVRELGFKDEVLEFATNN